MFSSLCGFDGLVAATVVDYYGIDISLFHFPNTFGLTRNGAARRYTGRDGIF